MNHTRRVWGLLTAVLFAAPSAIAGQSRIEGDLYLLTASGEVRPGAANEVVLIPRTPAVVEAWLGMCEAQAEAFAAAQPSHDDDAALAAIQQIPDLAARQRAIDVALAENRLRMVEIFAMARLQRDERFALLRSLATARSSTSMRMNILRTGILKLQGL